MLTGARAKPSSTIGFQGSEHCGRIRRHHEAGRRHAEGLEIIGFRGALNDADPRVGVFDRIIIAVKILGISGLHHHGRTHADRRRVEDDQGQRFGRTAMPLAMISI